MAATTDRFLLLHGWGGNKPAHWQEHLYGQLTAAGATVVYPKFPEPTAPNLERWLANLGQTLTELAADDAPLTVVCHSLGAITWMHYAAGSLAGVVADRVLLVAPPYVVPEIPPSDAPPGVADFFPPPMSAEGIRRAAHLTAIIASDTDDYATFEQTKAYADRLEIPINLLAGAGHISPYWGYGDWPWIREWCLRIADFPPQPKPSAGVPNAAS